MNSTMILIGFSLAVLMGAGAAALLAQLRPRWSSKRRALVSASPLAAVTLVATLLFLTLIATRSDMGGGDMRDLALRAVAAVGFGFTALAFFGGLLGAFLAQHRRTR